MSDPVWLEFVKIIGIVVSIWFGLIGWTLFRRAAIREQ